MVEYIGYNGGRGRPVGSRLRWSSVGYPHLVVDSRGTGRTCGDRVTHPIPEIRASRGAGASSREGCPIRRTTTTRGSSLMLPGRWKPRGRSILLPIGRWSPAVGVREVRSPLRRPVSRQRASVVLADVPFLSDFRRAGGDHRRGAVLRDQGVAPRHTRWVSSVFKTLSYFDVVNHAKRVTAPSISGGAMDEIKPPQPCSPPTTKSRRGAPHRGLRVQRARGRRLGPLRETGRIRPTSISGEGTPNPQIIVGLKRTPDLLEGSPSASW